VFLGELWQLSTSQATAHKLRSLVKSHRTRKTLENPADPRWQWILSVYFSINLPSTLYWAIASPTQRRILRTCRRNIAYNALPYNFSAPGKAWGRRME